MIDGELARIRALENTLPVDEVAGLYGSLARQWPRDAGIHQNLALALMLKGDFEAAVAAIDIAISLKKDPISYFIKGRALDEAMDFARSIDCYRKCLSRDKNNPRAKFYLSLAYLSLGDFRNGMRLFRYRLAGEETARFAGLRRWSPAERSGRVFIWAEQGIGDEIMFLQLLHLVTELDFAFTVECDWRLMSLLRANFPGITFVERGGAFDRTGFDYHIATGDLLALFHQALLDGRLRRPSVAPVSRPDVAARVVRARSGRKLIGLSWLSANADHGARRSVPVETLCRNLDPARHAIAVLQYLAQDEDLAKLRGSGFDCIADVDCFNDIEAVFALIAECDTILTIDNSVAHFAGAAGVDTHLLLPHLPNWRWGVSGATSYWYPDLHLHRRTPGMSWDEVADRIPVP
jgi:tetratricopeptide (TPR) repeat protein